MHFRLAIAGERVKSHQTTALHLIAACTFAGMGGLCFLMSNYGKAGISALVGGTMLVVAGLVLALTVFLRNRWLLRPRINRAFRTVELALALCTTAFLMWMQLWVPAGLCGLLGGVLVFSLFWEREDKQNLYVDIAPEGIRLPGFRNRLLAWPEVERVLLRFGVLTIDCHDNHLFQWNVTEADFDKETFETWCAQQIAEGKSRRDQYNDW
jgi:F0F1-type ATP synthase assembly protein I